MKAQSFTENLPPLPILMDGLIVEHGRARVMRAALAAFLRAAMIRKDLGALSPHLRKDVGLPPAERPPHWQEHLR